jgi:hypothetical protein
MDLDKILRIASAIADTIRTSYIKKLGPKKYEVRSEKNPNWSGGTYDTRAKAEKRLQQVEMFKSLAKSGKLGKPAKK